MHDSPGGLVNIHPARPGSKVLIETARPHLRICISVSFSMLLVLLVQGVQFVNHCFRVKKKWIKSALKVKKEEENWNSQIILSFFKF